MIRPLFASVRSQSVSSVETLHGTFVRNMLPFFLPDIRLTVSRTHDYVL